MGERRLCTAEVRGSNPLGSTYKKRRFAGKTKFLDADRLERRQA